MFIRLLISILSTLVAFDAIASPQQQIPFYAMESAQRIPDHYIVVMKNDAQFHSKAKALIASINNIGGKVNERWHHAINGFAAEMPLNVLNKLKTNPDIDYIEADQIVSISETKKLNFSQSNPPWGVDRIDQANLPLDNVYHYTGTGSGVSVYVIDTGIAPHADYSGRAYYGFDGVQDGWGAQDCIGHGTHVAGTIGGTTWGVAKGVNLYAVRVIGCDGSGSISAIISGVDWVTANHNNPSVANMSLGAPFSYPLSTAVTNMIQSGVTTVVAAGNNTEDACFVSPANVSTAITVGATDVNDNVASFSNYGKCVDINAPGVNITSSSNLNDTASAIRSGTSMASPHVAGVAALILEQYNYFAPSDVAKLIKVTAYQNKLMNLGNFTPNLLLSTNFLPSLSWSQQMTNSKAGILNITFVDVQNGWAVEPSGTILHTDNGGLSWVHQNTNGLQYFNSIHFINKKVGWVVGGAGKILHTTDGGVTWVQQNSTATETLTKVQFINAQEGWVVGYRGVIIHTTDGGNTWERQPLITPYTLSSINFIDENNGFIVGYFGLIFKTTDGGQTWTKQPSGTGISFLGAHFNNSDVGWAVGYQGLLLKTVDGGNTWQALNAGTTNTLTSVQFVDDKNGIITGIKGTLLHTKDGGNSWSVEDPGPMVDQQNLMRVSFLDSAHAWVAGSGGVILQGIPVDH